MNWIRRKCDGKKEKKELRHAINLIGCCRWNEEKHPIQSWFSMRKSKCWEFKWTKLNSIDFVDFLILEPLKLLLRFESNSYHWPSLLCTSNSYLLNWSTVIHTLQPNTHKYTHIYTEEQETRLNQIRLYIKYFFLLLFRVFIIQFLEFYSQTAIWCFACHLMKKKIISGNVSMYFVRSLNEFSM